MLCPQHVLPTSGAGDCCCHCKFERYRGGLVGTPFPQSPVRGRLAPVRGLTPTPAHLCRGELVETAEQGLGAWSCQPLSGGTGFRVVPQGSKVQAEGERPGAARDTPPPRPRTTQKKQVVQTRQMSPKAASEGRNCVTWGSSSGGIRDGFFLAKSGPLGAEVLNQGQLCPLETLGRVWRHVWLSQLV